MSQNKKIEFLPVGGVGQIGSNVTQIISSKSSILIDYGILFPYENFFGIDYLIADIQTIQTPTDIVFTHGHEDHIGAVVHLLNYFPEINIWASPFTARLIEDKLHYAGIKKKINLYSENTVLDFKDFKIHPIHVNHSIPETFGLFIEDIKKEFCAFFASDFKIDNSSPYEKFFNFEKLKRLSATIKKRLAFIDSTNITSGKLKTPSEGSLIPSFENIFAQNYNRYFVTLFSSNIHRIRTILEAAQKHQLTVFASGRSMKKYIRVAQETGHLPSDIKIVSEIKELTQKNKLVVLVAGCQADFKSAFRRIGLGEDKNFKPDEKDVLIYSSKSIPGNEKIISIVLNSIFDRGTRVVMDQEMPVHVSGHPGKEDLKIFYQEYNPTDVIPIHGETSFLHLHKDFVLQNFPHMNVHQLKNFTSLSIQNNLSIQLHEYYPNEPIIIHGNKIELPRTCISERRKLASFGVIFVSFSQKRANVEISCMGVPDYIVDDQIDELKTQLLSIYNAHNKKTSLLEEARVFTRNFFKSELGYRPLAVIQIV